MRLLPRTRWIRLPVLLLGSYGLVVLLVMLFENSLIFYPIRHPGGDWKPQGLAVEDAWFQADDGTKLHGWFVPHDAPRAVVLFAHGNGGNVTHRAELLREMHARLGFATLIFDYRGYGRSEGSPTGEGVLADARAARAWLAKRTGVAPEKLVIFGESLGAAIAVQLAAQGGARALILQNAFDSLVNVGAHHYPWLPVRLMLRTRLDSAGTIVGYRGPLLQFHGDADTIVPYRFGRKLFESANEPKQFVTLPGADHNDGWPPSFYDAIAKFVGEI